MPEIDKFICIREKNFDSDYSLKQSEGADRVLPEFLVLHLIPQPNQNQEMETVRNKMKQISFQMKIGDQFIMNLPLSFLCSFFPPIQRENKVYLRLPCEYLIKNSISCNSSSRQSIYYVIDSWNEIVNHVSHYSLITKNELNKAKEDKKIGNLEKIQTIQQLHSLYLVPMNSRNHETLQLSYYFSGKFNGFFIQACIEELQEIKLMKNGVTLIHYTGFLLEHYTKKISRNLLFLSFNPEDVESYQHAYYDYALLISESYSSLLSLTFSTPQNKIGIHGFTQNKFITQEGNTYLQHPYESRISIVSV